MYPSCNANQLIIKSGFIYAQNVIKEEDVDDK